MDSTIDSDLLVQRAASELLQDLRSSIPRLLFHQAPPEADSSERRLRDKISSKKLSDVLKVLDSFQESPQLLDPVLAELLGPVSRALIGCLVYVREPKKRLPAAATATPQAVCRLLYAFCKVRGYKVIIRFLSNEARHIAPVVEALEARGPAVVDGDEPSGVEPLVWEERYVLLLWLSHLVLTPFPLTSAGAGSVASTPFPARGWLVPDDIQFVGRISNLAHFYLDASSKERDAAVILLVRLVLRPDMQKAGLFDKAISWVREQLLRILEDNEATDGVSDRYLTIGIMSFVAGMFTSADARLIAPHISTIVQQIKKICFEDDDDGKVSTSSAVERKFAIKIYRSATIASIHLSTLDDEQHNDVIDEILEDVIGDLLQCLGDQDAPVRFAASKALSVITTKLQPDMAEEIIQAVLASLEENVIWLDDMEDGKSKTGDQSRHLSRDLNLVSPFRWQGLVLTLAHLLFRRAPPPSMLPEVLNALLLALSFEQRSTTGASIGNTVRDAANFGIWSLARRYSTQEISSVDPSSIKAVSLSDENRSVLQIVACELVCAACLDPIGNIRRGSSAALQELTGRHPDTVAKGISVVQTVDYHAISLLSKAITSVATATAQLSPEYHDCLLVELLGWRGVLAADTPTRRLAAGAIAKLAASNGFRGVRFAMVKVWQSIRRLEARDIGDRHGLVLALARLMSEMAPQLPDVDEAQQRSASMLLTSFWSICTGTSSIDEASLTNFSMRPALTAEAFCSCVNALFLCTDALRGDVLIKNGAPAKAISYIELSLNLKDPSAFTEAASAARTLINTKLLETDARAQVISTWLSRASQLISAGRGRQGSASGWLCLLSSIYSCIGEVNDERIRRLFEESLGWHIEIEANIASLEHLKPVFGAMSSDMQLIQAVIKCLQNYKIDQRGDIGSLVRINALECIKELSRSWHSEHTEQSRIIQGLACGLAAEKLDKVRGVASLCLPYLKLSSGSVDRSAVDATATSQNTTWTHDSSSETHFWQLLELSDQDHIIKPLLIGLSTTIVGATEAASNAAQEALTHFLFSLDEPALCRVLEVFVSILQDRLTDERTIASIIGMIVFSFETCVFTNVYTAEAAIPSFKSLFALVQKAHFKSTLLPKLLAAVDLYTVMVDVKCVHTSILKKLLGMLVHPFPKVRQAAAEGLFCATDSDSLLPVDWTSSPAALKQNVESVREAVLTR